MFKNALGLMVALSLTVMSNVAFAATDLLNDLVPDARLFGEARFNVLFLPIYDAALYTSAGKYDKQGPMALRLNYLTSLSKDRIIQQTVKAMKRRKMGSGSDIKKWASIMERYFNDINSQDQILIVFPDPQTVVFSTNGSKPETVVDGAFAVAFKDLWLGDNIRNKAFQDKLLGRN